MVIGAVCGIVALKIEIIMAKSGLDYLLSADGSIGREKRCLDIATFAVLGALALPVTVVVGAASAIDTRTLNPILRQQRFGGRNGRAHQLAKFRTIQPKNGELAPYQSFGTFDPRASKLAQFLRKYTLDELPEIYLNVLPGSVSFVGPRSHTQEDLEKNRKADTVLFDEWFEPFSQVPSGLTGKSQLFRHGFVHMTDELRCRSMRMDLDYFDGATLLGDMKWISRTPLELLKANAGII